MILSGLCLYGPARVSKNPFRRCPVCCAALWTRSVEAAREAADLGIPAICIFPYTGLEERHEDCAGAWDPDNHANRAIRAIKARRPRHRDHDRCRAWITYNINGHDGFVENGEIVNDRTVEALVKMALRTGERPARTLSDHRI